MNDEDDEFLEGGYIDNCIPGSQGWRKDARGRLHHAAKEGAVSSKKIKVSTERDTGHDSTPDVKPISCTEYPPMPLHQETKARIQRGLDDKISIFETEVTSTSLSVQVVGSTQKNRKVVVNRVGRK
jgi:hypothetical protein